jgi:toxin ParE1/3/4
MIIKEIIWTDTAKNDLREIINYIAYNSISIAQDKLNLIKEKSTEILDFPEKGRIIPELEKENITSYREIIISPWRLMYKIQNNCIYILAVIDGRRNIEDILLKRQLR